MQVTIFSILTSSLLALTSNSDMDAEWDVAVAIVPQR